MEIFKVVNGFEDTQDNGHEYVKNSIYPRAGYTPSEERIKELSEVHPKHKRVFIEKIEGKLPVPPKEEEGQKEDGEETSNHLTEADLKKLNKGPQEELIKQFGGNPDEAKNESERITLILSLQEKQQEQNTDDNNEPSPEQ
jgi:hypothetical protein